MLKAPLTLGQVLTAQARLQPDRRAAQDFTRAMTYREWNERACRLANGLLGLGLSKGDRVAVLAYNRIEWAEIYAATAKAGLVAVPINFRLTGQEALHILEDSGAAAILVDPPLCAVLEEVRTSIDLPDSRILTFASPDDPAATGGGYEDLIAGASDREPTVAVGADDPWCLMYTSGTTGRPKGA
ncbi:MAG: AMP-binding protein, partial [Limibacillus sp.]